MSPRTADCTACKFFESGLHESEEPAHPSAVFREVHDFAGTWWYACAKHHRPRFYAPRRPDDFYWGWKRRCEDFEEGNDGRI